MGRYRLVITLVALVALFAIALVASSLRSTPVPAVDPIELTPPSPTAESTPTLLPTPRARRSGPAPLRTTRDIDRPRRPADDDGAFDD